VDEEARLRALEELHGSRETWVNPNNAELATALGWVTIYFNNLDLMVSNMIWLLVDARRDEHLGPLLTAEMPFRGKLSLLESLVRHRMPQPENVDPVRQFVVRAGQASEKRDVALHSVWAWRPDIAAHIQIKITAKGKQGLHYRMDELQSSDVVEMGLFIRGVAKEAEQMRDLLGAAIAALSSDLEDVVSE
jgi:hypothetical protein